MTSPTPLRRRVLWICSIGDSRAMETDNQADYSGYANLPLGDNIDDLRSLARWILELDDDEIRQLIDNATPAH